MKLTVKYLEKKGFNLDNTYAKWSFYEVFIGDSSIGISINSQTMQVDLISLDNGLLELHHIKTENQLEELYKCLTGKEL